MTPTPPIKALCISLGSPVFDKLVSLIEENDVSFRKQCIYLGRYMGIPSPPGNLYSHVERSLDILTHDRRIEAALETENTTLDEFFNNPVYSGAVIAVSLWAQRSSDEMEEASIASFVKEIEAMDQDNWADPDVDFAAFFGDYTRPIHPLVAPNRNMARYVHRSMTDFLHRFTRESIIYPSLSRKLLPTFTRAELSNYLQQLILEPAEYATPASLEYLYLQHGITMTGPCEMGQRWQLSQLTPRTFYVAGPDAFNRSRLMKDFFNGMVDSLEPSERRNRVNVRRLHLPLSKEAIFYDLTSFTSNMALQRHFLGYLAEYVSGMEVRVYNPELEDGEFEHYLLSDLIHQYNELNVEPEYHLPTRFTETYNWIHGVAGFLGVFGNIASATFIHAAILLQLCILPSECGVAGDDAVVAMYPDEMDDFWTLVPLLGILHPEKIYETPEPALYLKRGTFRDEREDRLYQCSYLQMPMLPLITEDLRCGPRHAELSKKERFVKMSGSFLSVFRSSIRIDSEYLETAKQMVESLYHTYGIPPGGHVPQIDGPKYGFCPSPYTVGNPRFIQETIENRYNGIAELPLRVSDDSLQVGTLFGGERFRARSSRLLSYLCKIGYVEKESREKVVMYDEEGLRALLAEFDRPGPPTCIYSVLRRCSVPTPLMYQWL